MNFFSFRHILRLISCIPAIASLLALSACGLVEEPERQCQDTDNIMISFRIQTGNTSTTRAEDFYGNSAENHIDLNNLKILIFDENQKLKQVLFDNGDIAPDTKLTQLGPGFYRIATKLNKNEYSVNSKFAIVALANWKSDDPKLLSDMKGHKIDQSEIGTLSIDDLKEMTFTVNPVPADGSNEDSWMPGDNESWIPMFGSTFTSLQAYDHSVYNEGNPMPLPDVDLVRALTKIEIINHDTNSPLKINRIDLVRRNRNGFLVQDYKFTGKTANVLTPTIPENREYTTNYLRFYEENNTYSVYIPEMEFDNTDMRRAIKVEIDRNGEKLYKWIYLAPYKDGAPVLQGSYGIDWQHIKRNYYYRYEINSLSSELTLQIDVQPFSCVTLLPQFGLERTDDGYIVVRDSKGNIIKYIRPSGDTLEFKEDKRWPYLGTFTGVFDSSKRVLIGYFEDGRSIIFNYSSDDYDESDPTKNLDSWEIYSKPTLNYDNGKPIPEHLEETFYFRNFYNDGKEENEIIKKEYTHTLLDDKGRVIREYIYPSLEAFWTHYTSGENHECQRVKLAEYTGERYGDKTVTYYNASGDPICILTVSGNTEIYEDPKESVR